MAQLSKPLAALAALFVLLGGALAWWLLSDSPAPPVKAAPRVAAPEVVEAAPSAPPPLPAVAHAPPSLAQPAAPPPEPEYVKPATALEAALGDPSAPRRLVVDVAGILETRPAEILLRCLPRGDRRGIEKMRELGFDPFKDVKTIAVVGEVPVIEGRFDGVSWAELEPERVVERPNPRTTLYVDGDQAFALWDDRMLIGNRSRDEVLAVIARMEGEAPSGPAPKARGMAYGEIPAEDLFEVLPLSRDAARPLAALLTDEGAGLKFSVDVTDEGLAIDARLAEAGPIAAHALSAAFETAKAGGLQASAKDELGELLQSLNVRAQGADIAASMSVPVEVFARMLGDCAEEGELP